MRPYIILEGPDGGGKSTLAKSLEQKGYAVIHTGPPGSTPPYQQYMSILTHLTTRLRSGIDDRPVVFDRFHLGERVYGPVVRGVDRLGPVYARMLDRVLLGVGAAIAYCATDHDVMRKTWLERSKKGEELITNTSTYEELFLKYDFAISCQELDWHLYDYMQMSCDDLMHLMTESYKPNVGPGIGNWNPGEVTLMIGEQVARPARGLHEWPFAGVSATSFWLSEKLEEWKIQERSLYWVNAVGPDCHDIAADFVDELQPRKIIALGDMAADWCHSAGLGAQEVPSPNHWKRFMYGQPYPLKELLKS